jgi:cytidylate kinase
MPSQFNVVTIIGLGLIGGSLAGALKEKRIGQEIRGYDKYPWVLKRARERDLIDSYQETLTEAVRGAELVILAVPVGELLGIARSFLPILAGNVIISDVGSVKAPFIRGLESSLPENIALVGGHPIAGTERSGIEAAFPELFVNTKCILTPGTKSPDWAVEKIRWLWQKLGVEVICMTPEEHDRSLARISHLPHMVAYSLVNTIRALTQEDKQMLSFPAGGFKDFTRVASSHPIMWRDICLFNSSNILEAIDNFCRHLQQIRSYIAAGDGKALEQEFDQARVFRTRIKSFGKIKRKNGLIIALDGPASAGKSTLAKAIAQELNYTYISTGAIYRAVAWKARKENISWEDPEALEQLSSTLNLYFKPQDDHTVRVYLHEEDITDKIKDEEIGQGASKISAFAPVRKALIELQRNLGKDGGIIMDGRDIGTVIFPEAEIKFFLDASVEVRAYRRYKELKEAGLNVDLATITQSLRRRDLDDSQREIAPLSLAPDAIYIDTTQLSVEEVKAIMLKEIKGRQPEAWRF